MNVGPVPEEEISQLQVPFIGCIHQCRIAVNIKGIYISAAVCEQCNHSGVSFLGRDQQGGTPVFFLCIYINACLNK